MQKYLVLTLVVCMLPPHLQSVSVESRSADILCRVSARNILSLFAMRVFHESRGAKGLKGGFYSTIRTANQRWVLSLSGMQIRGGYYHYQDCKSGVGIVHGGKLEGVLFGEQFSADELKM